MIDLLDQETILQFHDLMFVQMDDIREILLDCIRHNVYHDQDDVHLH